MSPKQERERAEALRLVKGAKTQEEAEIAFDVVTGYLTDYCPDDENWEDFDPDVDEARDGLIDAFDL